MEIVNIFYLLSVFIIFFSIRLPIPVSKLDNSLTYIDHLVFNIMIQINLILFLSLLNMPLKIILGVYFSFLFVCFIFQYKNFCKIKLFITNHNYFYFFILIILFLICVDVAYSIVLDWDAQKFWFPKALNFYNNETIQNLASAPNPQYPFLGSLLWALFWKISFFPEEYTGRLVYVFLYCISIASLTETLKLSNKVKMIFFIILILLSYKYILFSGSQDLLIFCLISIAAKILYEIIGNKKRVSLYQFVLLLLICNSLIWTKQEGTIYAFIIIFTMLFFSKINQVKSMTLLGLVIFLFTIRIFVFKFYNLDISINNCCWKDLSFNSIIEKFRLDRIAIIITFFLFSFLKNSFFLLGLLFLLASIFSKKIIKNDLYIYFFYIMSYCFIFSAYILSGNKDLVWMLKTGIDRLIFSASPFYILIVVSYINTHNLKI